MYVQQVHSKFNIIRKPVSRLTKLFLSSRAYVFIAAISVCHMCCCIEVVPLSNQCSEGTSNNQDH